MDNLGSVPAGAVVDVEAYLAGHRRRATPKLSKTVFDYTAATLLLVFLAPVFILVAVAICLDSRGSPFFRQARYGLHGRIFRVWKFRTMRRDAADRTGSRLTARNDPRITRIGHWLRKTSIDELPQLFNVLAGDMSLVGPRPHPVNAKVGDRLYGEVVPHYTLRHTVKPGITGWAQVNGWRGETTQVVHIEQRVAHDLEYIHRQSLKFDLVILWLTVRRELFRSKVAF